MIFLISQEWSNTSENHAGMKYLCNKLQELYPDVYKSLVIPCYFCDNRLYSNRIVRMFQLLRARCKSLMYCRRLSKKLCTAINSRDVVFLMEYLERLSPMNLIAAYVHKSKPSVCLWAMVHLVPAKIDASFLKNKEFFRWLNDIKLIFTLGHTLSDYLTSRGILENKLVTSFHYVDKYYLKKNIQPNNGRVKIIAMGNQMRNIKLLRKIVGENLNADFTICQGVVDMSAFFSEFDNVRLIPYVAESDLRNYMDESDISLNVMEDTIGSNVIVTSMAMGLAMICSDVGSIRDYCDESNTIFCNNNCVEDFSNAIKKLSEDSDLLYSMRLSAQHKAMLFSIENFHKDIQKKVV